MTGVFLAALAPAALQACLAAAQQLEDGYDTALDQWRRQLEQARYAATTAGSGTAANGRTAPLENLRALRDLLEPRCGENPQARF